MDGFLGIGKIGWGSMKTRQGEIFIEWASNFEAFLDQKIVIDVLQSNEATSSSLSQETSNKASSFQD